MELLVFWILCGVVAAVIAGSKGRSPIDWFLIGCFIGLFALILVIVLPPPDSESAPPAPREAPRAPERAISTVRVLVPPALRQEEHEGASTLVKIVAAVVTLAVLATAAYAVLPQLLAG